MFWVDEAETGEIIPMKMPFRFVCEAFADMLGASKAYNIKEWKPQMLLDYWEQKCLGKRTMHEDSIQLLDTLIRYFVDYGEENFFTWYKENKKLLKNNY